MTWMVVQLPDRDAFFGKLLLVIGIAYGVVTV
jgi:hypothetical protein